MQQINLENVYTVNKKNLLESPFSTFRHRQHSLQFSGRSIRLLPNSLLQTADSFVVLQIYFFNKFTFTTNLPFGTFFTLSMEFKIAAFIVKTFNERIYYSDIIERAMNTIK